MASYLSGFKHLEIQLEEIKTATNNFHESKVIGVGGFGKVYKGELSYPDGKRMVAFKRLDRKHGQGDPEFFKEIRMLSSYKHKNLISLLGFCKEGDEMILMYEHASGGSLDRVLNKATLTWTQRIKICLDAAQGLSFLHDPKGAKQRVLHCDIKSANILLDESLNAKVADFGLSKISPANQQYTLLVTSPVGTPGYCDPLYMNTYQLTKESDVYSFGVVLFEVLCGRVCYENCSGKLEVFVHYWKKCYEQKKLDEIIFPTIQHQLDPSSVETFVDIAYQCLQRSREQRPTMSVVVGKLKAALEQRELEEELMCKVVRQKQMNKAVEPEQMRKDAEQEYKEIIKSADPPLRFLEFLLNGGKTLLHINDKGEVTCERLYIEACMDQIQLDLLEYPFGFRNSRFPGGRCYCKHKDELKVRVRAQFLSPLITYSVNLVFRNVETKRCKTLHFKLDGTTKCCMVYDTYEREDGWFVVPIYQFTSDHKTAEFEINFEGFRNSCKLLVVGFEFQRHEEIAELHDQGLEEYHDIVKVASQSLLYKSLEELKELLSIGLYINNYKTWFSLNENEKHCEMLSIAHCLIFPEGGHYVYYDELNSRFPSGIYRTNNKGFKVHIRTQFLTPLIRYTVNLVLCMDDSSKKQKYVALRYKLEGETETSIVYLANKTKDNCSFIAELYQFTSNGRTFDIDIVFEDHKDGLEVEGILFQPLEKVEHEQVLEDGMQWTMKWVFFSYFLKCFLTGDGPERHDVDKNGLEFLIFSAKGVIRSDNISFQFLPESRFQVVVVITTNNFRIVKKIESHELIQLSTTYECYLVYKSTEDQPVLEITHPDSNSYIYLVSPPDTEVIGENTHNQALNRHKLNAVPRKRKDGWMEVKVSEHRTSFFGEPPLIDIDIVLRAPDHVDINGLILQSIELRPINNGMSKLDHSIAMQSGLAKRPRNL